MKKITLTPGARQVAATVDVVRWYLENYFRTDDDPGTLPMFSDASRVGSFAIEPQQLRAGEPQTLFKLLVSVVMFQRRRDTIVLGLQKRMAPSLVDELTSAQALLGLVDSSSCRWMHDLQSLRDQCDLAKDDSAALCVRNPTEPCHLKRHTEALKRYGDFGKYPTSAALVLRDEGASDLRHVRRMIFRRVRSTTERAVALEEFVTRIHRVSRKLANMFLALVSNPDLTPGAPWRAGVDWTRFIVVDSNVDAFLASLNYSGGDGYEEKAEFVRLLARRIDLARLDRRLHVFNPRMVQQAMYAFMGKSNRMSAATDCWLRAPSSCTACTRSLEIRCPVRVAQFAI